MPCESRRESDIACASDHVEVSVVIPCLNEADTVESCVRTALAAIRSSGLCGEVIVADNGSTDGSPVLAERAGARVILVPRKGYGSALMGGIAAAGGECVVMGDADGSYDFSEIPLLVGRLREGYDLVQGCRLPAGGGRIMPGAMPFLHRWFGNPLLSWLSRRWFRVRIHDVYCGLRGFRKSYYETLKQRCTGMEFATEMIVKSSLFGARMAEVPITLRRDGRIARGPHLRTFRDGWRTLRFFLMYSPRWLFFLPGCLLITLGLAGYAIALPGLSFRGVVFDAHTLLFASLFILCGYQAVLFAVFAKTFAINENLLPTDRRFLRLFDIINLERGIGISVLLLLAGVVLLLAAANQWREAGWGHLDYAHTMRWVIPGSTLTALGVQTLFSSFFVSILGIKRDHERREGS